MHAYIYIYLCVDYCRQTILSMYKCWCSEPLPSYMHILNHTLPVPDVIPISIHIPYYTNVRNWWLYYNMFYCISFVMYNVESVLLSFCGVLRNYLLLIHAIMFDGFIFLGAFVTPANISWSIKLWPGIVPLLWVIRLQSYRKIIDFIAIRI